MKIIFYTIITLINYFQLHVNSQKSNQHNQHNNHNQQYNKNRDNTDNSNLNDPYSYLTYYKKHFYDTIRDYYKYYDGYKFLMANLYKIAFNTNNDLSLQEKPRYTEELVYTNKNRKANNTQRQLTNFGLDLDEYDNIENENKRYLTQNTTTTTTTVQG